MLFAILIVLISCKVEAQNDYNLTNERMDLKEYDKDWVAVKIKNFKYNRTHAVVNLTVAVIRPLGSNLVLGVQAYKFASNEYRLFPLSFNADVCKSIENNDFGVQNMYQCGNFSGCPINKGHFEICNWLPDESKFPPYIPSGRYMVDLKILRGSQQIVVAEWYIKVEKKFRYV